MTRDHPTEPSAAFQPFANESDQWEIDGLTVENRRDRVALYGSLDLSRDRAGLARARALKAILDQTVAALEAATDLPDALAPAAPPDQAANPFI